MQSLHYSLQYVTDVLTFNVRILEPDFLGYGSCLMLSQDRQKSSQIIVEQMFCSMMVQNKHF
jgi:hypothetical protein